MFDMKHFIIPGEPQGKGRPRFSRGHAYTPEPTRAYEDAVRKCFLAQCGGGMFGKGIPLSIRIEAVHGVSKADTVKVRREKLCGLMEPTKKPDASNILKAIEDALNGVAYYDDSQIIRVFVVKKFGIEPCVKVWLREADGEYSPK